MNCPSFSSLSTKAVCVLLLAAAYPANAEEALGRLFFTPERRQALDQQRQFNIQEKQVVPEDPSLTINGVVTRSSGRRTVWINGVAQNENSVKGGISVIPQRNDASKLIIQGTEFVKKDVLVGDNIDSNTGESTGILNGGRVRVHGKP